MQAIPKDNMDETVRVRLSPIDLAAWQHAADADHRTLSDWIRMRCEGLSATEPMPRLDERRLDERDPPPTATAKPARRVPRALRSTSRFTSRSTS